METNLAKLATKEEVLEVELAIIGAAHLTVEVVGYQDYGFAGIWMYNLVSPQLPGYNYSDGLPTFTLEGLRSRKLVK